MFVVNVVYTTFRSESILCRYKWWSAYLWTCILHTERQGDDPVTFLLWGNSANHSTTMLLLETHENATLLITATMASVAINLKCLHSSCFLFYHYRTHNSLWASAPQTGVSTKVREGPLDWPNTLVSCRAWMHSTWNILAFDLFQSKQSFAMLITFQFVVHPF